jgi:hypothetical protein
MRLMNGHTYLKNSLKRFFESPLTEPGSGEVGPPEKVRVAEYNFYRFGLIFQRYWRSSHYTARLHDVGNNLD